MTPFRRHALALTPRGWLDDPVSQKIFKALGGAADASIDRMKDRVAARFARLAPDDALAKIGVSRRLEQAPEESYAAYRLRLVRAFEIHGDRGTAMAYKHALEPLGVNPSTVDVYADYEDSILPAAPGSDPWWSRVTVVVDSRDGPWTSPIWSDVAVWTETEVWGVGGMTRLDLMFIRRYFRHWKWSGDFPLALVLILAGSPWGEDTVWSDGEWSDAPSEVAVIPLAHVWGFNEAVYGAPPDQWSDDSVWPEAFVFED